MSVHMTKTVLDDGYIMVAAYGKSTDSKPSFAGMATGSTYTAVDTGDVYFYDGTNGWTKMFSFKE